MIIIALANYLENLHIIPTDYLKTDPSCCLPYNVRNSILALGNVPQCESQSSKAITVTHPEELNLHLNS